VPPTVTVHLGWASGGTIEIVLPFPANQVGFSTLAGRRLASAASVAISQLVGVRAIALVPARGHQFRLEGTLLAGSKALSGVRRAFVWQALVEEPPGMHSLELGGFQQTVLARLNSSDDLDCAARLSICSDDVVNAQTATLVVRRYDLDFEPGYDGTTFRIPGQMLLDRKPAEIESLRVEAVSLIAPNEEPIPLEPVGIAEWSLRNPALLPGPWLILGWSGQWCRVRPRLYDVPEIAGLPPDSNTSSVPDRDGIAAACAIGEQKSRKSALTRVMSELATKPDHPDWSLLRANVRLTEHLPPSTFDVMCALGENADAAAMAALAVPEGETELFAVLWRAMHSLPFCWLAVPRSAWHTAASRWLAAQRSALEIAQLPGFDAVQMVNAHAYESARRMVTGDPYMPWLAPVLELARSEALGLPCSPETLALRRGPFRQMALGRYWDAIARLPAAPYGATDPVPWTYGVHQYEHVLHASDLARLRVNPSRQRGVIGEARAAYLNAPAIAAALAVTSQEVRREAQVELRTAHAYDPAWFADAYHWAFLYVLGGCA
jgi:hypothetical protein